MLFAVGVAVACCVLLSKVGAEYIISYMPLKMKIIWMTSCSLFV